MRVIIGRGVARAARAVALRLRDPATSIRRAGLMTAHHDDHFYRFHRPHAHLTSVFGNDWFALKAEAFARFFGTPVFLIGQTVVVAIWILMNSVGVTSFDIYPFILLNLLFSTQAAYAAPLILLAQTRQADRDKAHADSIEQHREEVAKHQERQEDLVLKVTGELKELLDNNTTLTREDKQLTESVAALTKEIHSRVLGDAAT